MQRVGTQPEWRQSLKQVSTCGGPVTTTEGSAFNAAYLRKVGMLPELCAAWQ